MTDTLRRVKLRSQVSPYKLANLGTANNDSRRYVILGNPAVRLPVAGRMRRPRPGRRSSCGPSRPFLLARQR